MHLIEINPLDKIDEILEIFKQHNPKVFSCNDEGYDWLECDSSRCIFIKNPYCENDIELSIGDDDEFVLNFSSGHAHYLNYEYDYERLIENISDILKNTLCSGTITDSEGKWYGSGFFEKEKINDDPQNVFKFVFDIKEFRGHLTKMGYKVEYTFWNPTDNKTITFSCAKSYREAD
jgi:hypothetical protein